MSKASDWAARRKQVESERPAPLLGLSSKGHVDWVGIQVTDDGKAMLSAGNTTIWLQPEAACAIARWILDTLGEAESC